MNMLEFTCWECIIPSASRLFFFFEYPHFRLISIQDLYNSFSNMWLLAQYVVIIQCRKKATHSTKIITKVYTELNNDLKSTPSELPSTTFSFLFTSAKIGLFHFFSLRFFFNRNDHLFRNTDYTTFGYLPTIYWRKMYTE